MRQYSKEGRAVEARIAATGCPLQLHEGWTLHRAEEAPTAEMDGKATETPGARKAPGAAAAESSVDFGFKLFLRGAQEKAKVGRCKLDPGLKATGFKV